MEKKNLTKNVLRKNLKNYGVTFSVSRKNKTLAVAVDESMLLNRVKNDLMSEIGIKLFSKALDYSVPMFAKAFSK